MTAALPMVLPARKPEDPYAGLGICPFHHHRCIHEGHLKLEEHDGVRTWLRRGTVFTGGAGP